MTLMRHCNWTNCSFASVFVAPNQFVVLSFLRGSAADAVYALGLASSFWYAIFFLGLSWLYAGTCGISGPTLVKFTEFTEFSFFVWNIARPNWWCGTTSLRWTWHLWCSSWGEQQGSKHHNCHWHMIHMINLCSGTFSQEMSMDTVSKLRHCNITEVAALWFPEDYPAVGSLPMQAKTTWRRTQNPMRTNSHVEIIGSCQSRCHETKYMPCTFRTAIDSFLQQTTFGSGLILFCPGVVLVISLVSKECSQTAQWIL